MARSEVTICNRALDIIGGLTITTLNDNTKSARVLKRAYEPVLHDLLEKSDWTFATKRVQLVLLSETPAYGYTYALQKPTDYLRVLEVSPNYAKYSVEEDKILSNFSTLKMKYIAKVTNPNSYTSGFAELLAKYLAADICVKITQNTTLAEKLRKEAKEYFEWVTSDDSKASGTLEVQAEDIWMGHRGYGTDSESNAVVLTDFDYGSVS